MVFAWTYLFVGMFKNGVLLKKKQLFKMIIVMVVVDDVDDVDELGLSPLKGQLVLKIVP